MEDKDSPLTWEGRYTALRAAYDKNRATIDRVEALLADWKAEGLHTVTVLLEAALRGGDAE